MRKLLSTVAVIGLMTGVANANPLIDNSTNANATSKSKAVGVGVGVGIGYGGGGGGGGSGGSVNIEHKEAASSAALSLGASSFGAAAADACPVWMVGRGQYWGVGSGGAVPGGSGSGLFSRGTTEESHSTFCGAYLAAVTFRANNMIAEATKVECTLLPFRKAYDAINMSTCAGVPVIEQAVIRTETETMQSAYRNVSAPAVVAAVAPAPQTVTYVAPPAPDYSRCSDLAGSAATSCLNKQTARSTDWDGLTDG